MNNSESSEESTDALKDEKDEETSRILKSMECFEDVHKHIVTKSASEFCFPKLKASRESEKYNQLSSISKSEDENTESETDNDYTTFLKQLSVRYSHYRLKSGEESDSEQRMDYSNCNCSSCSQCSSCDGPSCSWQASGRNGQECTLGASLDSSTYLDHGNPEFYSYGKPLPNSQSASDETIVNGPRASTPETPESPANSYNFCCPLRRPGQQPACCYSCNPGYPCQGQLMPFTVPPNMEIDPATGFPYFACSMTGGYPGMGMCPMPTMQVDPRGRGGQQNEEMSGSSSCSGSSQASGSTEGGANNKNTNGFNMEEFMQKYQKSVQQCYATAQKGLHQTFAQVASQPTTLPQGSPPFFGNANPGAPQMFASPNQAALQFFEPNQEAYQGMPPFGSPLDSSQFFSGSSLGVQPFLPPPMTMPPPSNIFGNNSGFISDTLHTQTVYSSDYKSFANDGNHFNHFPNGIDIGLGPDACPGYGPAGSPGMAEMGAGGQAYGMGGGAPGGGMNMSSFPLNHMSYPNPYTFDMSSPSPGQHPGLGMANSGNLM